LGFFLIIDIRTAYKDNNTINEFKLMKALFFEQGEKFKLV